MQNIHKNTCRQQAEQEEGINDYILQNDQQVHSSSQLLCDHYISVIGNIYKVLESTQWRNATALCAGGKGFDSRLM